MIEQLGAGPDLERLARLAESPRPGGLSRRWVLNGNPIPGMLIADLDEDQRTRMREVLDGLVRERAGANGRAVLTNAVSIGFGTK